MMKVSFVNTVILLMALFGTAIKPAWALSITGVGAEPNAFDPAVNQTSQIRFKIDQQARVTLRIYDQYERMVRDVESNGLLEPGEHQLNWDGRDNKGQLVPGEAYHYTLNAEGNNGSKVTHDITDLTVGDALAVKDVYWDKETSKVQFTLTKSARVKLRAGVSNYGPLLKTLLDWMPRQAGKHSLEWDGWDESKVLNISTHPKLEFRANAFRLPRNTIFILPLSNKIANKVELSGVVQKRVPSYSNPTRARDYARQPAEERRDIALKLDLIKKYPKDADGVVLVKGQVPIRVDVAEARYASLFKQRFEPVFFVDGIFLGEIEAGFLPVTYVWDSRRYNQGTHYLTVNIVGFEGAKGSATIRLKVGDQ